VSSKPKNPETMDLRSLDISADNRAKLKQLFPTVFLEAKDENGKLVESIDFEKLKAELGIFSYVFEGRRERYGMDWPGKKECLKIIQQPSIGTLKPCRDESVNFETTENLFIEGDNLEVLKLLQKSYYGKVKMIYIDPPYNTGKEFIYPDKYSETLETYLAYAGLVDDEGKKFATNTANEGRYHTKWLNMMYPRLYLARNLLQEDGVIFISIDDNELVNLRKLCDEIFGEENFLGTITVQSNPRGRQSDTYFASVHDYLVCYAKNSTESIISGAPLTEEQKKEFKYTDSNGELYRLLGLRQRGSASKREDRPDMFFPIYVNEETQELSLTENGPGWIPIYPQKSDGSDGRWMWGKDKVKKDINLLVPKIIDRRDEYDIFVKDYLYIGETERTRKYKTIWDSKLYNNQAGTQEVKKLIKSDAMSFPKPKDLIKEICRLGSKTDSIIVDFFAGSGTTAHAVLDLNKEDHGARKFLLIQLPENTEREDFKTIADIGKERIRRVIKTIEEEQAAKAADPQMKLPGVDDEQPPLDLGFKVFKLDKSNFRIWDGTDPNMPLEKLEEQLSLHVDHIDPNAGQEDILYELLLKAGFMPTEKVESIKIAGKTVFSIADGALLICLEDEITRELIDAVAEAEPMQFICLDRGFKGNDQLKANAVQTFAARNQGREKEKQIVFRTV
jgi:adenine-specific DNA-methyltransferase